MSALVVCAFFPATAAAASTPSTPELASTVEAAEPTPGFTIYYSPNCTNAGRLYSGLNPGERWVNDVFNNSAYGSAGLNQRIVDNAASIRVVNALVGISTDGGYSYQGYNSASIKCFNISQRNQNNAWYTRNHF